MQDNDQPLRNANDFPLRNISMKLCLSAANIVPLLLENEPFNLREMARSVRWIALKRIRKLNTDLNLPFYHFSVTKDKVQTTSPAKKRNYLYLFTASHSYDAEEPVHLISATVTHYLKCFKIKPLREVLLQAYFL